MRYLEKKPVVATILTTLLIFVSVFAVQSWMTDRRGAIDNKSSIVDPPI